MRLICRLCRAASDAGDLLAAERTARIFGPPDDQTKGRQRQSGGKSLKKSLRRDYGFTMLHKMPNTYAKLGVDELPTIGGDLVFGLHPVRHALLNNRRRPKRLFIKHSEDSGPSVGNAASRADWVREIIMMARNKSVPVDMVSTHLLDYLVPEKAHQGVALEATALWPSSWLSEKESALAELRGGGPPGLWVFLDGILDPMNLGAVLRSAYFLGVSRVLAPDGRHARLSPAVSKASAGVMEIMPLVSVKDKAAFLNECRVRGMDILGSSAEKSENSVNIDEFCLAKPSILVVGNEGSGMSSETASCLTKTLRIEAGRELAPGIDSLNVSVSAALLMFAALRSRRLNQSLDSVTMDDLNLSAQ